MKKHRIKEIVTFVGEDGKFYFNIRSYNNKTILPSEGYNTEAKREQTIELINSSLKSRVPVRERK